jgi:hypothetical protein
VADDHICAYCGLTATTLDHFTPVSVGAVFTAMGIKFKRYLIPACGECNCIAGAKLFKTIGQKRHYIKGRIKEKYKKFLACPNWAESELEELGWTLRTMIEQSLQVRAITRARLRSVPTVRRHSNLIEGGKSTAARNASKLITRSKRGSRGKLGDEEARRILDTLEY